jgi:type I restriction enzyme R subunit
MADPREKKFQSDIVAAMEARGWRTGNPAAYDRDRALYPEDVLAFVQEAHHEAWEKFCRHYPNDPQKTLLDNLERQLQRHGTLSILRNGFKDRGVRLEFCQFQPDHAMNEEAQARFEYNRLRVVPEVSYSPYAREDEYNPRLDLVLFVNGLPVATMEVKSAFQQSVQQAIHQYRKDRPPKAPTSRKAEPLLAFKRGALVHFAVSQDEVWMTTHLNGRDTIFLPFNRGTDEGGAGNPEIPDDYDTAYLWKEVLAKENWLRILGRYVHLEREDKEDFHGRPYTEEKLIFPRYHQWDAVSRLLKATRREGPGHRYLIQHSAGSGKSNSIAWTAHQIASLYNDAGEKMFRSVLVVTDRTVLDDQLQETIYQFEQTAGLVVGVGKGNDPRSKSEQLAEALDKGARIIVVTIQTFPALFQVIAKRPDLGGADFAVIADEAHSSQTGASAGQLRALLGGEANIEGEEVTGEDLLDATVAARGPSEHISYYAFTATPKSRTLHMFGRPKDPNRSMGNDNLPEPFHVYSMRQAIEEGFILDVLENYITYKVAFRLAHEGEEQEVDSRRASSAIARWVRLHPVNIGNKVQIIVEHFRDHVLHLLDGQAKAMVVTSSRKEAVRYKLAMEEYVRDQGYDDIHALVAFSGEVEADSEIPEAVTETSRLMNPNLNGRDLREAFDTDEYNVMIVANKFQTGFDQPKLCAMYVDRRLKDVDCVQTLSRLNRPFPGKRTFVLDFINDAEEVQRAFAPYYNKTELTGVSDPNTIYEIQNKLDDERIYYWEEVRAFATTFFDPKASQSQLQKHCRPAVERFRVRYREALQALRERSDELERARREGTKADVERVEYSRKQAGEEKDRLDRFRKNLGTFVRFYEFMSQIVPYEDPELEQLAVFARYLRPLLRQELIEEDQVDLSGLELTHYRITKQREHRIDLGEDHGDYRIDPPEPGDGTARDPEKKELSEIVKKLNELFGAETTDQDKVSWFHSVKEKVKENEPVMAQVRHNPKEQVLHGDFPRAVEDAVLDSMNSHNEIAREVLSDEDTARKFMRLLLRELVKEMSQEQSQQSSS